MEKHADNCPWLSVEIQGEDDPFPGIMTLREEKPPIEIKDYPEVVNIYWPYEEVAVNGLPPEELYEQMGEFADALHELDGNDYGFMMYSVVGNDCKEWTWYVKNVDQFLEGLNTCLAEFPELPIEIDAGTDANWEAFNEMLALANQAEEIQDSE